MKVSVIIPVYKAARFVEQAVVSALFHKEVKEVLLIEDGSPDNSLEICQALEEKYNKVKLFQHAGGINKGAGASRNIGLVNATQDYIAFLDADDYYTKIRFIREKNIFFQHKDCDAVYGAMGVEYGDEKGENIWESRGLSKDAMTTVDKVVPYQQLFCYLSRYKSNSSYRGHYSIVCLTIKRISLAKTGLLFPESLKLHQDTVFIWQLAYYLRCYTGEYLKPVAIRRVHSDNRIFTNMNVHYSRCCMYLYLRDWSIVQNLPSKYSRFFNNCYLSHFLSEKNIKNRIINLFGLPVSDFDALRYMNIKSVKIIFMKLLRISK